MDIRTKAAALVLFAIMASSSNGQSIPNAQIDYKGFKELVVSGEQTREARRLTEADFIKVIAEQNTVLLDARSEWAYKIRHVKGAVSLPFTDFTEAALRKVIPSKNTKILIYCNNNFTGSPLSLPTKMATASLNLSTYNSLRAYGYENVFELGPVVDTKMTNIPFEGLEVKP